MKWENLGKQIVNMVTDRFVACALNDVIVWGSWYWAQHSFRYENT